MRDLTPKMEKVRRLIYDRLLQLPQSLTSPSDLYGVAMKSKTGNGKCTFSSVFDGRVITISAFMIESREQSGAIAESN